MAMSSMTTCFSSQPRPVGQMIETVWPASRSALASCHTRRSNGDGRFSTRMSTRFGFRRKGSLRPRVEIAPLDVQGDEAARPGRVAAHPKRRRLAGERLPIDRLEAVPGVLVARAVALAVAAIAGRSHVELAHGYLTPTTRNRSSRSRAST